MIGTASINTSIQSHCAIFPVYPPSSLPKIGIGIRFTPTDVSDEENLARLVALNHERAEDERCGLIRWLRPEFQNPSGAKQTAIAVTEETTTAAAKQKSTSPKKQKWPKTLSEQAGAVHAALASLPTGASSKDIAKSFGRATPQRVDRIEEILETLAALGKARELDDDRYVAV